MKTVKRICSFLLALVMVLSMIPATHAHAAETASVWDGTSTATAFAGGSGTSSSPYQIATAAQLNYLAKLLKSNSSYSSDWSTYGTKYYKLTADIDMGGYPFMGIHYFNGSFDGNRYTISGLNISSQNPGTESSNLGLFGICEGATIKNLTTKGNIYSSQMSGGIAAQMRKGTISNCVSYCTVYSGYRAGGIVGCIYPSGTVTIEKCKNYGMVTGGTIGGIVGELEEENSSLTNRTIIRYCANVAGVQGKNYVGGIAGYSEGGSILYCANVGSITCLGTTYLNPYGKEYAGGIVGELSSNGSAGYYAKASLQNCYNAGSVTSVNTAAGIAPRVYGNYGVEQTVKTVLKNCYNAGKVQGSTSYHVGPPANELVETANLYYLSTINSGASATTATPLDATQMTQKASFSGFSFSSSYWGISSTASYAYPYISTIGQLPTACSHYWADATCQTPQTCTCCGLTQGSLGNHKYKNGVCTLCGKNQYHKHDGLIYTEWTSASELPSRAGRYCLTQDVVLTQEWTAPTGEVSLCLNGHTVSGNYTKTVGDGSALNLFDCADNPGTIKAGASKTLTSIQVLNGGTLNISDVTVSGYTIQSWNDEYSSSVVAISNRGTVNLYSGTILADTNAFVYRGATTVALSNAGAFNMYGGEVHAFAESHSSDGYYYATGIDNSGDGICKIYGGQILAELGTTNSQLNKRALALEIDGPVYFAGTPTITGLSMLNSTGAVNAQIDGTAYTGGVVEFWDRYDQLVKNHSIVVRGVTEGVNDTKFTLIDRLSQPMTLILEDDKLLYDNGDIHEHTWTASACGQVRYCSVCEFSDGVLLDHSWNDATCIEPKICTVCGATEGEALGHDPEKFIFTAADATISAVCGDCNADMGSVTLLAPNGNSNPYESYNAATVTGQIQGITKYPVTYCCQDGCTVAGPHTATLTVGGVQANAYFNLQSATLSIVSVTAQDRVYNGNDLIQITGVQLSGLPEGADVQVDLDKIMAYLPVYTVGNRPR